MSFLEPTQQFGWDEAGPVAGAYGRWQENGTVAVCVGSTGSGKTTESIRRTIRVAQWQHPSPIDGIRKGRTIVLAPTYRKLWDQVIGSYKDEISWATAEGGWKGGQGEPAQHIYDFMWQEHGRDVGQVHVEVLFRAPGENQELADFFRGLKATAWWFPEMDTQGDTLEAMLSLASNRTHRYPEMRDRPDDPNLPTAYGGVFGDANAPVIGSVFHDRFFLERRPSDKLFLQPPGYDPSSPDGFHALAENVVNLRKADRKYYITKAANHDEYDRIRLLENKPGYSRDGKPVHPLFNSITMSSVEGLTPDPSLPVVVGLDAGSNTLSHAAVFVQRSWGGQVRVLAEIPYESQTDIVEVSAEIKRLRDTQFAACKSVEIVVDPAAGGQSAMKRGVTWAQMIQGLTGMSVRPAPSNDPGVRRAAVDQVMNKLAGPGIPAFICSAPHTQQLMKALAGMYHYEKVKGGYRETPKKNSYSHIADALQYAVLGLNGVGIIEANNHADEDERQTADHGALLPD